MADNSMLAWDEAIDLVMQRTGKNRRQAEAALVQKLREGKIPATGIRLSTGLRETIPPEAWPSLDN